MQHSHRAHFRTSRRSASHSYSLHTCTTPLHVTGHVTAHNNIYEFQKASVSGKTSTENLQELTHYSSAPGEKLGKKASRNLHLNYTQKSLLHSYTAMNSLRPLGPCVTTLLHSYNFFAATSTLLHYTATLFTNSLRPLGPCFTTQLNCSQIVCGHLGPASLLHSYTATNCFAHMGPAL